MEHPGSDHPDFARSAFGEIHRHVVAFLTIIYGFQLCGIACAAQYRVGNSNGWNNGLTAEAPDWGIDISFHPKDTLYFSYVPSQHNVVQVADFEHYQTCNITTPVRTWNSGSDIVVLPNPGSYYFVCGMNNQCKEFQLKVAVLVQTSSSYNSVPPEPTTAPVSESKASNKRNVIVGVTVAVSVAVVLTVGIAVWCRKCNKRNNGFAYFQDPSGGAREEYETVLDAVSVRPYTLAQVKVITFNFENKIGQGGFGSVFYGKLSSGQEVAVKTCSPDSRQGHSEFVNEVKLLSRLHHKNIVPLLGYCKEEGDQILMYEFMDGGDLQSRLHDIFPEGGQNAENSPLTWRERLSIALDAARGLEYLHHGASSMSVIHRDIKSSNILLTRTLVAKVADFGLSKLGLCEDITHISTQVKGTYGYLDPGYNVTRQLTAKSDVYSFGVLLLELVCGRPPIFVHQTGANIGIVEWVKESLQSNDVEDIVDPLLRAEFVPDSVRKVIGTALECVSYHRQMRPSMSAVVRELKQALNMELGIAASADADVDISESLSLGVAGDEPPVDTRANRSSGTEATSFDVSGGRYDATEVTAR